MAVEIPFVREMRFTYGEAEQVSPLVRRVVARNPGLFTLYGTNTYLVGRGRVVVIDPGPLLKEHQAALRRALGGETVSHILVTHRHLDHCEAATALARETGALAGRGRPGGADAPSRGPRPRGGGGRDLHPRRGAGPGRPGGGARTGPWRSCPPRGTPPTTSATPCPPRRLLFTGDHVMGWSTSVVIPPDGDMRAYVASLRLLQSRDDRAYLPGHGPAVTAPHPYVTALAAHRAEREREILSALAAGHHTIPDIVGVVYAAVDPRLHPAAGLSVLAHLRALVAEKRVACHGRPRPGGRVPTGASTPVPPGGAAGRACRSRPRSNRPTAVLPRAPSRVPWATRRLVSASALPRCPHAGTAPDSRRAGRPPGGPPCLVGRGRSPGADLLLQRLRRGHGFVNRVALAAQAADHHPDIDIRWNRVTLRLTTHSVGALTDLDRALVEQIDALGA